MKEYLLLFSFILTFSGLAYSQNTTLKSSLNSLNNDAKASINYFKSNMAKSYNVSESTVNNLLNTVGLDPAETFMAFELAKISNKKPEETAQVIKSNKGKGWGVIAQQLGIKPGSPEFKALKGKASSESDKIKQKKK